MSTARGCGRSCSEKLIPCEGFEPLVGSFCTSVAETVRERSSSSFYLSKDTFDAVGISVAFVAEIETVTTARVFQCRRTVDEKHGVRKTRCVLHAHENCDAVLGTSSMSWLSRSSWKNAKARALFLVGSSCVCSNSFVSGSGQRTASSVRRRYELLPGGV